MKEYYIDCRELTNEQVEEVCKELERLGYSKTKDYRGRGRSVKSIASYYDGYFGIYTHATMFNDEIEITLEELKQL